MKISIITATFNSGTTLEDTFKSILTQTYSDIEYIVIDGASSDSTLDIIKKYEPLFKGRMRWISEPDKGIYDAMNKGFSLAKGDVVGLLNSDDFFTSPEIIEKVAKEMENQTIDAVYGDIHFVKSNNLSCCTRYYSSRSFKRWKMRLGFMPAHPSFYCRRWVFEKYGVFDCSFKIAADFEYLLRLIFVHNIKIKYIPLDFVTMRAGGASTSGLSSHKQILIDHLKAYKKNKVHSNIFLESIRYFLKSVDVISQKLIYQLKRLSK